FKADYEPDLSYIESAAQLIAPVLKKGDIVILESTSPVGATEQMVAWLRELRSDLEFPSEANQNPDVYVAYCPERVLPGKVVEELISNDRIIGGLTPKCALLAESVYRIFVKGQLLHTNARTAEMSKLTENSFRDVNIAFANELSMICDKLDINVWELINLANHHPRVNILQPGPGVGGHCIAVDPWFIVSKTPEQARLIKIARVVNDSKPEWVIDKVNAAVVSFLQQHPEKSIKDVKIACFGLAFKPDIDDLRESPSMGITLSLAQQYSTQVIAVEPNVEDTPKKLVMENVFLVSLDTALQADVLVLLVDHQEFKQLDSKYLVNKFIVDTKGIW
ncbi:MAG: UDP-N-acetyl-D-mannosamine dehydrogenase, partial [Burkholderiales bacterium]|nr:UDP-N-acetyl-D-mannosamine dehydrogenase [Burkholderiales bacterium]